MKLLGWKSLLLLFSLLISCSRAPELATSAAPKDFDGRWIGTWNWDTNRTTTLAISGTHIKVTGFPVEKPPTTELIVASSEGQVEFQTGWSRRAPCVLILLPNPKIGVPIYITRDKKHLVYDYDVNVDRRIIFVRLAP